MPGVAIICLIYLTGFIVARALPSPMAGRDLFAAAMPLIGAVIGHQLGTYKNRRRTEGTPSFLSRP